MKVRSRLDPVFALVGIAVLAVFLPKMFVADSPLYTEVLTLPTLYRLGCVLKLLSLWSASVFSMRVARSFASGDAMRRGWTLVSAWLFAWAIAQSILGVWQIGQGASAPYPSLGDAFFVLGYPAMITGFLVFIRAFTATGLVGAMGPQLVIAALVALPGLALVGIVLRPVLVADVAPLERVLNMAYPLFDWFALVPALVLARVGLKLAGGALFIVWALLSLGIVCLVAADLLYGWFSSLEFSTLDPMLDVLYLAAYLLVARAVYQQYRVSAVSGGAP